MSERRQQILCEWDRCEAEAIMAVEPLWTTQLVFQLRPRPRGVCEKHARALLDDAAAEWADEARKRAWASEYDPSVEIRP